MGTFCHATEKKDKGQVYETAKLGDTLIWDNLGRPLARACAMPRSSLEKHFAAAP